MPRLPGQFGSVSRMARPAFVSIDGLATIEPPHVSIMERRNGLAS